MESNTLLTTTTIFVFSLRSSLSRNRAGEKEDGEEPCKEEDKCPTSPFELRNHILAG
jgi:hypothetical protein